MTFSLGLILVLVGGAELFTGNTLLVIAWAEERAGIACENFFTVHVRFRTIEGYARADKPHD